MQDPSAFQQIRPQFPEHEQLKCPRCDSINTKFCYYNNYNLSQPRHFCKNCRRYWTKGGALRNIPVGGGSRKSTKRASNPKRSSSSSSSPSSSAMAFSSPSASAVTTEPPGAYGGSTPAFDIGGSFRSLLAANGQMGNLLDGLNPREATAALIREQANSTNPPVGFQSNINKSEAFLGVSGGDSSCWGGGNGGLILPFTGQVRPFSD